MKEKPKYKLDYQIILLYILMMAIPLLLTIVFSGGFIMTNFKMYMLIMTWKGKLIDFIITYTIFLLLLGITRSGKKSITIFGVFLVFLSIVNQLKYSFMGEPVFLTDISYLGNSEEIFSIVQEDLLSTIGTFIIPLLLQIVIYILLIYIARVIYKGVLINNKKIRLSLIIIPIIILSLLFLPIKSINSFFSNYVYHEVDYNSLVSPYDYYLKYGVFGGLHGQLLKDRLPEPIGFNKEEVNNILDNVEDNSNKRWGTPNIFVFFGESFWDIDKLDEIEFNKSVTPNYNRLKEEGLSFNMISPVYGGVSANVEYEFLTGSNVSYFSQGFVPYMQLYKNKTYYNRPSIIKELKDNGYNTKIVTTGSPKLFNCGKFYKYIDVDTVEYVTKVDKEFTRGKYVSDKYLVDKLIKEFEKTDKDQEFYMILTMESHMPYPKDKFDNYDVWVTKSDLSSEMNDVLTSYAEGIYDADKELKRLYDYIKSIKEPTIIVFYGDHLPYLKAGKENALEHLKYFNTGDSNLDTFRKYNTESLILANFKLDKKDLPKYLGPDLLGSYILNNMDINISNYYKYLYNSRNSLPSYNHYVSIDKEGNIYNTNNLPDELKEQYNERRNIEYKLFVK